MNTDRPGKGDSVAGGGGGDGSGGGDGPSARDIGEAMMAGAAKAHERFRQEIQEQRDKSNELWQQQVDEWERAMRARLD